MQETSYLISIFFKFSDPPRKQVPLALAMLAYKSPPFSLGFPVFQSPSTSFTKVRVGSPARDYSFDDIIVYNYTLPLQTEHL